MRLNSLIFAGALGCLAACAGSESEPSGIPTGVLLEVEGGEIEGVVEEQTRVFRGIPYAAAPTGERRWRAPEPAAEWDGTRDASTYGPVCPQNEMYGTEPVTSADEDCLSLNVWTPSPAPTAQLPVIVFFHGGSFVTGSSRGLGDENEVVASYTGEHLVPKGNVVLVTANYRLGALGFMRTEEAAQEDDAAGNYGLMDQQAALRWVRDNIATFGGDPANVTIAGESAGGIAVCAHLRAPDSAGLFHRAISQSGPCELLQRTTEQAEAQGEAIMASLGCSDLACMRALPAAQLVSVPRGPVGYFGPVNGTAVLPYSHREAVAADATADVPVLLGSNADEGTVYTYETYTDLVAEDYEQAIVELAPVLLYGVEDVAAISSLYPVEDYNAPFDAVAAIYAHRAFNCPARSDARSLADRGVYMYHFDQPATHLFADTLGTTHGVELLYVFGTRLGLLGALDESHRRFSDEMIGYWSRFAHTGDPNGGGAVSWPQYDGSDDALYRLNDKPSVTAGLFAEQCDYWDDTPL